MRRCALAAVFITFTLLLSGCSLGTSADPLPATPQAPAPTALPPTATAPAAVLPTETAAPPVVIPTATEVPLPPTSIPTPPPSTATKGPSAQPTTASQTGQELLQIEKDTAKVRGLQPRVDVPEIFLSKGQLHDDLVKEMNSEYTQTDARRDATELWLFRLIDDRSIDLYQLQLDMLTEQVAGYYDPEAKKLFVLGTQGALSPLARETLAHEYVHGLQDQYYDLQKMLPKHSTDGDRIMAVKSLIEGDASLSGMAYSYQHMSKTDFQELLKESSTSPTTALDKAPRYVRESLLFPYVQGAAFVTRLIKQGGFKAVDAALGDPPASTEQILHPEKYLQKPRDLPLQVALPPLTSTLGTGWTQTSGGTIGEFDLQIMLEDNNASNAAQAAAGWDGGEYALYQKGTAALAMAGVRWDTKTDTDEFEAAMLETFKGLKKEGNIWSDPSGRYYGVVTSGDVVVFAGATDPGAVIKALAAVK